jgi:thiamine kinase-like enzyme
VTETPESVLATLPEWAGAVLRPLDGGLTNRTWLVEAGARRAVLKTDAAPRGEPFNSRPAEARIQAEAARHGLANRVLLATDTVYLTEYVEGVTWSPDCLGDDANLERLAAALRRLHALPLSGRTFDAIGAAEAYAREIAVRDEARIGECLRKIADGPRPLNRCLCHNDLVAENIIATPDIRFLDWEYACDNDPLFDLATIVAHHNMHEHQVETLLDAYFDGDGEKWSGQLARQADVYDALLYLWDKARPQ